MPRSIAYTEVERAYYQFEIRHTSLTNIIADMQLAILELSDSDDIADTTKTLLSFQTELKEIEANMKALKAQFKKDVFKRTSVK